MGIEIYPQILKSGLAAVNTQLNQTIENAQSYIKSIEAYIVTESLDSIAFGSQKDYMNRGHLAAVRSQIQAIQSIVSANQKHMNLIESYLGGETYISEETLQEQLQRIRNIQQITQNLQLTGICNMISELGQRIREKIENLYDYEQAQRGLYDSVMTDIATAEAYGNALHSATYDSNTDTYVLPLAELNKADKEAFYNSLPDVLRGYIGMENIEMTKDGFFVCTKSMKDILNDMGLKDKQKLNDVKINAYDDWYLSGVVGDDGKITYTLIKMREPTDSQGRAGSAVPFVSLNMKSCVDIFEKLEKNKELTNEEKTKLGKEFYKVTNADGDSKVNKTLLNYFKDPTSKGSYMLADCMVNKVKNSAQFNKNGIYKVPTTYEENDEHGQRKLDELTKAGIYSKKNNTITIKDRNNLTQDEYDAILLVITGDQDSYAYAAENQWHAEAMAGDFFKNPFGLKDDSAIKSDAGVGESKGLWYEKDFKSERGTTYKEQKKQHK